MATVLKTRRDTLGVESLTDDEPLRRSRDESPGAIASRQAARHAARAEVKQQIAEAIAAEERWTNLKEAARDAENDRCEAISDIFAQSQKAQEEIELIDEQHIEGAASGAKQTPETKARRAELVSLLGRLSDEKEKLVAPHDKIIERIKLQCFEAKKMTGFCHHQFALIGLGRPDLIAAMRLAHGEASTAMNKLEAAKAQRAKCASSDSQMREFWDSQIVVAEARVASTKAALDIALQAVYDE